MLTRTHDQASTSPAPPSTQPAASARPWWGATSRPTTGYTGSVRHWAPCWLPASSWCSGGCGTASVTPALTGRTWNSCGRCRDRIGTIMGWMRTAMVEVKRGLVRSWWRGLLRFGDGVQCGFGFGSSCRVRSCYFRLRSGLARDLGASEKKEAGIGGVVNKRYNKWSCPFWLGAILILRYMAFCPSNTAPPKISMGRYSDMVSTYTYENFIT